MNHANESRSEEGSYDVVLRMELDRVSSRLNTFNYKGSGTNMSDLMKIMQSFGEEFATLEPKLTFISMSIRDELHQIRAKEEGDLHEYFEGQIEDCRKVGYLNRSAMSLLDSNKKLKEHHLTKTSFVASKAKDRLKQLEGAHDEHTANSTLLSNDLKSITEELDRRKKQIDSMVNSVTDANPLVEIRAAIQRLRKENRELDIHIGMLVSVFTSGLIITRGTSTFPG